MQFLTHYHSDHTSGVPDVWLTGWLESHFGTRKTPYRVIGPTGARELIENLERAYALDIKIRVADEKLPLSGIATEVTEFDRDGVVYEKNGVKVIAFEVDHGDVIKPCYGYRIEYGGRVAAFSSDTRYNQNVIKYGAGADLLVHEVASARPELMREAYIQRNHRAPHDAARGRQRLRPDQAEACRLYPYRSARQRTHPTADHRRHRRRNATDLRRTAGGRRGLDGIRHRRDGLGGAASITFAAESLGITRSSQAALGVPDERSETPISGLPEIGA